MTIAVSASIKPSRSLFGILLVMCICIGVVAALIGADLAGCYSPGARTMIVGGGIVCPFFAIYHEWRKRRTLKIDISGIGQIRIKQNDLGRQKQAAQWQQVRLSKATTIWHGAMFLVLGANDGSRTTLCILPDCVSCEEFRSLSVACRWIVANCELSA